jgi:thioredoxin reductase
MLDVIIVGGGAAGLSAALVLGRCRRNVLLIDSGNPRNAPARHMHGFLSRDGMNPGEFLQICRQQLRTYPNVELRHSQVLKAGRGPGFFTAILKDGEEFHSRIMLLATGLVDELPTMPGFDQFWGASVHLCPYCDGWEHRDETIAVYGRGLDGAELALEMLGWTSKVVYCTDGESEIDKTQYERLEKRGIRVDERRVAALEGTGEKLERVRFEDGGTFTCSALFFSSPQQQRCNLAHDLGCQFSEDGYTIECAAHAATNVPGLYAAGNASKGLQLVIMAAADGTQAAFSINEALLDADIMR